MGKYTINAAMVPTIKLPRQRGIISSIPRPKSECMSLSKSQKSKRAMVLPTVIKS